MYGHLKDSSDSLVTEVNTSLRSCFIEITAKYFSLKIVFLFYLDLQSHPAQQDHNQSEWVFNHFT